MIYMNNAATSYPKPGCVAEAMANCVNSLPGAANRGVRTRETFPNCREYLARLMEVSDESRIIYTMNATMAINLALLGFPWKVGDRVLSTTAEHNSVLRPLYRLKKEGIIEYKLLESGRDGRISVSRFQEAIKAYRPRLAVITHASNVTGGINPIEELAGLAKDADCRLLLDASQTLGMIPVLPEKWKVDMVAFTGHKYLLGPQGTGGLYLSREMNLNPVLTGGTGIHSEEEEMPSELPLRLEAGTPNEPSFQGLAAALKWREENPADLSAVMGFIQQIREGLNRWGFFVTEAKGECTPVISFWSPVYSPEEIGEILLGSYDIICRTGLHCAPKIWNGIGAEAQGTVRISLSRFTTQKEVEVLLEALEEIGKDHGRVCV